LNWFRQLKGQYQKRAGEFSLFSAITQSSKAETYLSALPLTGVDDRVDAEALF